MMETYSIGYNELMDFPYLKYLEFAKILSIEKREEQKEKEQMQSDMDHA